jgi:hypothetical protein
MDSAGLLVPTTAEESGVAAKRLNKKNRAGN